MTIWIVYGHTLNGSKIALGGFVGPWKWKPQGKRDDNGTVE